MLGKVQTLKGNAASHFCWTMAQQVNHQLSTADKIYVFDINFYTVFDIVFNTVFDTISDTTVFDTLLPLWSFWWHLQETTDSCRHLLLLFNTLGSPCVSILNPTLSVGFYPSDQPWMNSSTTVMMTNATIRIKTVNFHLKRILNQGFKTISKEATFKECS